MTHTARLVVTVAMLAFFAIAAVGCSRGSDNFTGKWKALSGGKEGDYIEIKRDGSAYQLYIGNGSSSSPAGVLVEEGGKLVTKGPDGKNVAEITYEAGSGHLKWQMGGGMISMEMQRQ